ncbi:thioredoxin [Pectobacterium araliae]|uniref:Thioredoxin n=1 Tax=Pectobacterium araliae TaxID=3073862 RepID=A0AAN0MLD9_9GAMM|nr:thioredoxin [Pectobacterium sp. MAFF 302110]GKW20233.1 thioredoxin [Pectobacterium carotovorum subsp. carotovorum]
MSSIIAVTEHNYTDEVELSELPVLIDFWAPWCAPCRALAPTIEEVAQKYDGKIKVVKINVDEAKPLSDRFGVKGIPALFIIKDGNIAARPQVSNRTRLFALLDTQLAPEHKS